MQPQRICTVQKGTVVNNPPIKHASKCFSPQPPIRNSAAVKPKDFREFKVPGTRLLSHTIQIVFEIRYREKKHQAGPAYPTHLLFRPPHIFHFNSLINRRGSQFGHHSSTNTQNQVRIFSLVIISYFYNIFSKHVPFCVTDNITKSNCSCCREFDLLPQHKTFIFNNLLRILL